MVACCGKKPIKYLFQIEKIIEKRKDKKLYHVRFIWDNTIGSVSSESLCSFDLGLKKNYHISKKKNLLSAIEEAKKLYEQKEGVKLQSLPLKEHDDDKKPKISFTKLENRKISLSKINLKSQSESNTTTTNAQNVLDNSYEDTDNDKRNDKNLKLTHSISNQSNYYSSLLAKSKRKKEEEVVVSGSLLDKITNYLKFICKSLSNDTEENEKDTLTRVFNYLKKLQMENPIEILKVSFVLLNNLQSSQLGIIVKYLFMNFNDDFLKELSEDVKRNFEEQALDQIFSKK